jgi:hypothetical protein
MNRRFHDRLSALLTNYEGNGDAPTPTAEDFYSFLAELQRSWDMLFFTS